MSSLKRRQVKERKRAAKDRATRLRREQDAAKERRDVAYLTRWPQFVINENGVDRGFVSLVSEALQKVNFDRMGECWEREAYRIWGAEGHESASEFVRLLGGELVKLGMPHGQLLEFLWPLDIGYRIWNLIGEEQLAPYYPWCNVQFFHRDKCIVAHFSQLCRIGRSESFHSPHRPTIKVDGREYLIGFSKHICERIAERLLGGRRNYGAWCDAFANFHSLTTFERAKVYPNQEGVVIWDVVGGPEFAQWRLVQECVPEAKPGNWYWRAGYCPLGFDRYEGVALVKTFLVPGYRGTPEYGEILRHVSSRSLREHWDRITENQSIELGDEYIALAGRYHRWGVRQVKQSSEMLYEFDLPTRENLHPKIVLPAHVSQKLKVRVRVA